MSDLSRLLDDLYAMGDTEAETAPVAAAAPPAAPTEAPAWSSDEALDEVFETWVPGPDEDAPAAHRSFVEAVTDEPFVEAPAPVNWNLGLEDEPSPVTEAPNETAVSDAPLADAPGAMAVAAVRPRWSPSDDDILPGRRSRSSTTPRSRTRRR
ncbi:MAG TPA: hypothetical protein VM262_17260 [Acidimicrobiales bacterium]|nr:hypothetical protein [Acidimicrobiales bacterium]